MKGECDICEIVKDNCYFVIRWVSKFFRRFILGVIFWLFLDFVLDKYEELIRSVNGVYFIRRELDCIYFLKGFFLINFLLLMFFN